jgi:hypothetical protein
MDQGHPAFDQVVRLLTRDVVATLGDAHAGVVEDLAANVLQLDRDDRAEKCVEDVQQYFQDTFVDTTWPACPRHPNHPLDYSGGAWRCPRDGAPVARLGELPPRPGRAV